MGPMTPRHLGPVHQVEQALTLLLAFGPFVLLGAVVLLRRRDDTAQAGDEQPAPDPRR